MATKKNERDPSITSASYDYMAPKWEMIETLLGGTAAMRAAGPVYLPAHSAEEPDAYADRLSKSTLYNVTELTLASLAGRVFREEMKLNPDVPDAIEEWAVDVDCEGTNITSFCQRWFRESVGKGYAHVLIDMPTLDPATKQYRTRADDIVENRKPYWCLIKPENAIFLHREKVNGVEMLTHARLVEWQCVLRDFVEVKLLRIRVLTPGAWEVWKNANEDKPKEKPEWVVESAGTSDFPIIPLVTYNANRDKPPLEDLAYMNVRHWQSTSDQINILTVSRFPMLAASGTQVEKGKNTISIGPRQLLSMRDPNGKFYYVEHNGKSINAGQDDLEQLEDRMAAYGAEFLRRQISGRTAFERAQDTNEAISPLKDMALRFQEAVNMALHVTAQWLDIAKTNAKNAGGTVTINTKFTQEDENEGALKALGEARKRGDISRKTFIGEIVRRGIVEQTLNVDEEIAQIEKEFAEGPHPPTFYTGQEQVQGKLNADGTVDDSVQPTLPGGHQSPKKPTKTKAKGKTTK